MDKIVEYIFESTSDPYVRVQRDTSRDTACARSARHFLSAKYLVNSLHFYVYIHLITCILLISLIPKYFNIVLDSKTLKICFIENYSA